MGRGTAHGVLGIWGHGRLALGLGLLSGVLLAGAPAVGDAKPRVERRRSSARAIDHLMVEADRLRREGDHQQAARVYQDAYQRSGKAELLCLSAEEAWQAGDLAGALARYRAFIAAQKNPRGPLVLAAERNVRELEQALREQTAQPEQAEQAAVTAGSASGDAPAPGPAVGPGSGAPGGP